MAKSKMAFLGAFVTLIGVFWCIRGGLLVGASAVGGNLWETLANVAYCLMGGLVCSIGGLVYKWDRQ